MSKGKVKDDKAHWLASLTLVIGGWLTAVAALIYTISLVVGE